MSAKFESKPGRIPLVEIKVDHKIPARAMLDTGTAISLITADFFANVEHNVVTTKMTAKGAGRQTIELFGDVSLQISLWDVTSEFEFHSGAVFRYILFGVVRSGHPQCTGAHNLLRQSLSLRPGSKKICVHQSQSFFLHEEEFR